MPEAAPETRQPEAPMLQSKFWRAMGFSVARKESADRFIIGPSWWARPAVGEPSAVRNSRAEEAKSWSWDGSRMARRGEPNCVGFTKASETGLGCRFDTLQKPRTQEGLATYLWSTTPA